MTTHKNTCLCPVCMKQSIPKRCKSFRSTCPPKPPAPVCDCQLSGIHAQLITGQDVYLGHGDEVIFNTIINNRGGAVDMSAGVFSIKKKANYLVNWSVAVEGCGAAPFVCFALKVGNTIHSSAAIPVTIGMLSGSAFVTADENTYLALVNNTHDTVRLQLLHPIANITIVSA